MKTSISIVSRRFFKTNFRLSFLFLLFFPLSLLSQETLVFERSIPIEASKRKKAIKEINEWLTAQPSLVITLKQSNPEEVINVDSYFSYENPVKYEGSATYSRMYALQTNGKISYQVNIFIKDDKLIFKVGNFKHTPIAKGDKIEFGILTTSESAPNNLKYDYDAEWCDKVWVSMKKLSEENAIRFFDQLPSNLMSSR